MYDTKIVNGTYRKEEGPRRWQQQQQQRRRLKSRVEVLKCELVVVEYLMCAYVCYAHAFCS